MHFVKFPNSNVWAVDAYGWIEGTVRVSCENQDSESMLNAIANAATGSAYGLADFSYSYRGEDIYYFRGCAEELPEDEADYAEKGFEVVANDDPQLIEAFCTQFGLSYVEAEHAVANLDQVYDNETVVDITGTHRQIRTTAFPEACSYVRVTVGALEIAYWASDEWRDAPQEVMGAIMGCAHG